MKPRQKGIHAVVVKICGWNIVIITFHLGAGSETSVSLNFLIYVLRMTINGILLKIKELGI